MTGHEQKPPAPTVLADMCAMQAWNPHIDEHCRLLLGWYFDTDYIADFVTIIIESLHLYLDLIH